PRDEAFQLEDAALVHGLGLLGGVVLGVLRQVAERARVGDRLDDPRPLDLLAVAQLLLERRQALHRHRYFFHQVVSIMTKGTSRAAVDSAPAKSELRVSSAPPSGEVVLKR